MRRRFAERVDETQVQAATTKTSKLPLLRSVRDQDKMAEEPDEAKCLTSGFEDESTGRLVGLV